MRERSGRTKKPCPGCGKVVPYRKVSEVCNECRKDIREGQSHRKSELAGQRKKELVIVQFPEYEHWLPSLHHASPAYGDHKYESHVRTTFLELAKAASEPASGEHVGEQLVAGTDRRYGADANRTMPSVLHPLLQELYTCLVTSNKNAYENGQTWARQQFDRMVHGQISLKDFAEYMKMNPKEITAKVVFSSAKQTLRVHACLCRAGQVDARGAVVTPERLADIEKAYREKGVAVERLGDELWATGEIPQEALAEVEAGVRAELISGLPSNFSIGAKEGGKDESSSDSGED